MIKLKFLIFLICITLPLIAKENPNINEAPSLNESENDLLEESGAQFKLGGYYKNLFVYQKKKEFLNNDLSISENKKLYTDLNRIRISPQFKYADILIMHIDYDNEVIFSNHNKSYQFDNSWRFSQYNDLWHSSYEPIYNEDYLYRHKFQRAYLKLVLADFTLTLGRQQIRFGSGKLWNPLDILNPVSPIFLEGAEEQKGTDAARLDYYFNDTTELSLVYSPKRFNDKIIILHQEDANQLGRLKTTWGENDFAILGGKVARRNVAGGDIAMTILDGILTGSILYSKPEESEETEAYLQGGAGYEYTFKNSLYFLFEYFYNENALNDNDTLRSTYGQSFFLGIDQDNYFELANQFITYNCHYLGLALGYDFHPLLRGDLSIIYDIEGRGIFFSPVLKYNIFQNMDLSLGIMSGYVNEDDERASDFVEIKDSPLFYWSGQFYF